MRIEFTNSALREDNLFPNKFVPILANYDPLALLITSTTSPRPYEAPVHDENMGKNNWPLTNHQFSFVQHDNVVRGSKSKPKSPSIIHSSIKKPTPNSINLLAIPSPSSQSPPISRPSRPLSNRKPFKLSGANVWDIRFNLSKEILDLLVIEKINLENISQAIDSKSKLIVTSSRFNHRDEDVFVGRANNPFGYSTKWKLR